MMSLGKFHGVERIPYRSSYGLDIQVSQFVLGAMAESIYFDLPMDDRTRVVRQIARALSQL